MPRTKAAVGLTTRKLVVVFVTMALGCVRTPETRVREMESEPASLISLIAAPAAYDGRRLRVVGVLQLEFEQDLLYVSRQDFDHRVLTNAVAIRLSRDDRARWEALSGQYVGVEGIFRQKPPGTRMFQAGSVDSITRVAEWAPPAQQR